MRRHQTGQHFGERDEAGVEIVRFRIGIENQRERDHALFGVEILSRPRNNFGDTVRLRHRYVERRLHHLRTVRGSHIVFGQVQQSNAEILHGPEGQVSEQGDQTRSVQGTTL